MITNYFNLDSIICAALIIRHDLIFIIRSPSLLLHILLVLAHLASLLRVIVGIANVQLFDDVINSVLRIPALFVIENNDARLDPFHQCFSQFLKLCVNTWYRIRWWEYQTGGYLRIKLCWDLVWVMYELLQGFIQILIIFIDSLVDYRLHLFKYFFSEIFTRCIHLFLLELLRILRVIVLREQRLFLVPKVGNEWHIVWDAQIWILCLWLIHIYLIYNWIFAQILLSLLKS